MPSQDIYFNTEPPKMTYVYLQVDTAGNKWYSEFQAGSTAPIRTWQEPKPGFEIIKWRVLDNPYSS